MAALEATGVVEAAHLPARLLSQGQRRRVALAKLALGAALTLWVLDEPFTGLDAAASASTQALAAAHLERGGALILTTHQDVAIAAPHFRRLELA